MSLDKRLVSPHYWRKWLLFGFVFATASYGRTFAYLGIQAGPFPIYVTEIVLGVVLALYYWEYCIFSGPRELVRSPVSLLVMIYVLYGLILLGADYSEHGAEAVRDSAMLYYALFVFVGLFSIDGEKDMRTLGKVLIAAGIVSVWKMISGAVAGSYSTSAAGSGKLVGGATALYATFSFIILCVSMNYGIYRKRPLLYLLAAANLVVVFFSAHRTFIVVFIGVLFVHLIVSVKRRGRRRSVRTIRSTVGAILIAAVIVACVPYFGGIATATLQKYGRLLSLTDPNTAFRIEYWNRSLETWFETNPLMGIGLGAPADVFVRGEQRTAPHNSYITVGLRTGLVGFGLLVLIMLTYYAYAVSIIRILQKMGSRLAPYAIAFLLCQVATAIVAFFNIVLEGPYMGSFFWLFIGLTIGAIRLAQREISHKEEQLAGTTPAPIGAGRTRQVDSG